MYPLLVLSFPQRSPIAPIDYDRESDWCLVYKQAVINPNSLADRVPSRANDMVDKLIGWAVVGAEGSLVGACDRVVGLFGVGGGVGRGVG